MSPARGNVLRGLATAAAAAATYPAAGAGPSGGGSLAALLTLSDHNTRVVLLGVACLGLAAGLIGTFLLLRERALLGDALSHATLPGIGVAFLLMVAFGANGKSLTGLLIGATLSGLLGVASIQLITHFTRIRQDAALGIILSAFFGLGVAILTLIQHTATGNAAGLETFIYGRTASMLAADAKRIAWIALGTAIVCLALFKELRLLCFDTAYATTQGRSVLLLDGIILAATVVVTVVGLQAVGLILIIALLVIPPAAARFWTERLWRMLCISGLIGAASGLLGAGMSALAPRLPAGAVIVLVAGALFAVSLVFGTTRGLLRRTLTRVRLARRTARDHLLRAMYELTEGASEGPGARPRTPVRYGRLAAHRAWSGHELRRALRACRAAGLIAPAAGGPDAVVLTDAGVGAAWRVARNHRLWEMFLIARADVAPGQVDREADRVEHVLGPEIIEELERQLASEYPDLAHPPSPHPLAGAVT